MTLGGGGQAQVYVVRDSNGTLPGDYAMKVLVNSDRQGRLDLEISTTKSLFRTGAPVLEIIDDYTTTEPSTARPWYVAPIADGGSLAKLLRPNECFGGNLASALSAYAEIVDAVLRIHAQGVAHRDLKPANILMHQHRFILADLGLCLPLYEDVIQERLTGDLERIGSIHYTPKEAFSRQTIDRGQLAFDAYALGKILYELVAGQVLPAFLPPHHPDYDLTRNRRDTVYLGINAVLRSLLHDDPARRLEVLRNLPKQVTALQEWDKTGKSGTDLDVELRNAIADASNALGRLVVNDVQRDADIAAELKSECETIAKEIFKAWSSASAVQTIEGMLVSAYPELLALQRNDTSPQLRQILTAPYTRSHRALEPLEDAGYGRKPMAEAGCALTIAPQQHKGFSLPTVSLGCLVGGWQDKVSVAFAIAKREPGIQGYVDIYPETVEVISGSRDDAALLSAAQSAAEELSIDFGHVVAEEFRSLAP